MAQASPRKSAWTAGRSEQGQRVHAHIPGVYLRKDLTGRFLNFTAPCGYNIFVARKNRKLGQRDFFFFFFGNLRLRWIKKDNEEKERPE